MFILQMASSSNPERIKTAIDNPTKGQKRKEIIYSHQFLTKDNDDHFLVITQRNL